jgi:hypothetical protein
MYGIHHQVNRDKSSIQIPDFFIEVHRFLVSSVAHSDAHAADEEI